MLCSCSKQGDVTITVIGAFCDVTVIGAFCDVTVIGAFCDRTLPLWERLRRANFCSVAVTHFDVHLDMSSSAVVQSVSDNQVPSLLNHLQPTECSRRVRGGVRANCFRLVTLPPFP